MMLLFDQNISFRISKKLQQYYPDCKHLSECGLLDCDDIIIWKYAKKMNYIIVTFDSDFFDYSIINGHPPKIIWLRSGNVTTRELLNLFISNINIIEMFLKDDLTACLEIA
jgi:predicted nuclease of predicted toxin-antitoxin system